MQLVASACFSTAVPSYLLAGTETKLLPQLKQQLEEPLEEEELQSHSMAGHDRELGVAREASG